MAANGSEWREMAASGAPAAGNGKPKQVK